MRRSWSYHGRGSASAGRGRLHISGMFLTLRLERAERRKNQHFFQALEIGGWLNTNLLERVAGLYFRDSTHGKITREDAVHAAGNDALPQIHFILVRDIFHNQKSLPLAPNRGLDPGTPEHWPNA